MSPLLFQEDCSQQDTAPDELCQRSVDLDDLEDLEFPIDNPEERLGDSLAVPVPNYLPHSRSLSHLSRMDKVNDTTYKRF